MMKKLNLLLIITILISGCSSFFKKNPAFESVNKVALVGIYIDRDLGRLYWQKINDQKNTINLDKQRLMNASHTFLQQNMTAHLGWQVLPDIRNTALSQVQGSGDQHYENLHGMALLSAEAVQLLSEGKSVNQTTLAIIKEICKQLQADALAVLIIDSNTHHSKLLSVFSKNNLPEISLRIAIVNQAGDLILNTDEFPVSYSADSVSEKALARESEVVAHEKILTMFQNGIGNALDQYFYQSAQEFKRMGYVLNGDAVSKSAKENTTSKAAVLIAPAVLDKTPPTAKENKLTSTRNQSPAVGQQSTLPKAKPELETETKKETEIETEIGKIHATESSEKQQSNIQAPAPKLQNDKTVSKNKRDLWSSPVSAP